MNIDLQRFHQGFFDEVDEHVATIEQLLLSPEARTSDREQLDAIFRAAHSIKGGSGTFGFTELAHLTHRLENVFDDVRNGRMRLEDPVVDAALHALDAVREMVARHREGATVTADIASAATAELTGLLEARSGLAEPQAGGAKAKHTYEIEYRSGHADHAKREVTYNALLGAVADSGDMLQFELGDSFRVTLSTAMTETEVRDLFDFVLVEGDELTIGEQETQDHTEPFGIFEPSAAHAVPDQGKAASDNGPAQPKPAKDETIRVSLAKVDQLINLVGEIVTAENILAGAVRRSDQVANAALFDAAEKVARHTRDLRQIVMSIRMVPISFILGRFPRVVRETAAQVGKRVELHLSGEDTELDKTIVERIVDPLTHLVRNAVDHGIETPEDRIAAGKSEHGNLALRASHQSGNIVIEVVDDGAGLSRERILAKARTLGWEIADDAPDGDVWDLIFQPGFSTASKVTEVSGRGVGMDVVRRNVADLGGNISLDSSPGKGTRVTIHLPLTLAILDGLTVLVGSHTYVVPIANVVASVQPAPSMVRRLPDGEEVFYFSGEPISLRRLYRVFAVPGAIEEPERGIVVVVEAAGRRVALLIDALDAQQQLVIKSLETNFRRTKGIAGATVIDNGKIALILDVLALVRSESEQDPATANAA